MESEKEQLYKKVLRMKRFLIFMPYQYGINIVRRWDYGIKLERIPFKTRGLRGMSYPGTKPQPDIILLNSKRSEIEQNFDCAHELVHLTIHRNLNKQVFNCFDRSTAPNQDPFLEWQANEGAAEFFVPYKVFIPHLKECIGNNPSKGDIEDFRHYAADLYCVPPAVIKYRIESLKYEILQYYSGISIDDLQIISKRQQERMGLYIKSLNEIGHNDKFDIYSYIEMKNRPGWNQNGFHIDLLLPDYSERYTLSQQ